MEDMSNTTAYVADSTVVKPSSSRAPDTPDLGTISVYQTLLRWLARASYATFFLILIVWVRRVQTGPLGSLSRSESAFGWHVLMMALAFPVFMSEAILQFAGTSKSETALPLHLFLHVATVITIMLGLIGIVYYKGLGLDRDMGFPKQVYSPHSWIGISCLSLWTVQVAGGFFKAFKLFGRRRAMKRVHAFLGSAVFVCGLVACATGLEDMQSSDLATGSYPPHSSHALMVSGAAIMLIVLGLAVFGAMELKRGGGGSMLAY